MQVRVDWVLRIFETQVIKKKRPVRPVFPDYLSVSYDYVENDSLSSFKLPSKSNMRYSKNVQKTSVSVLMRLYDYF